MFLFDLHVHKSSENFEPKRTQIITFGADFSYYDSVRKDTLFGFFEAKITS